MQGQQASKHFLPEVPELMIVLLSLGVEVLPPLEQSSYCNCFSPFLSKVVEETRVLPRSWTDRYLIKCRLLVAPNLHTAGGPGGWPTAKYGWIQGVFLGALGDFPRRASDSPTALIDLWNEDMASAADEVTPRSPRLGREARSTPWFIEELRVMLRCNRLQLLEEDLGPTWPNPGKITM